MGFLSKIFKPKWKSEDSKVRLEAIDEIDDEEILIELAKNDTDENVRRKSTLKITNQDVLFDIAKCDEDRYARENALNRITDKNLLLKLCELEYIDPIRYKAQCKLVDEYSEENNQNELIKIVENDENDVEFRKYAIGKITDENVLAEIYKTTSTQSLCKIALDNISNQELLVELLGDDPDLEVIKKITDDEVLINIALNDDLGPYRRETAISNLTKIDSFEKLNTLTSSLYDVENYGAIIINKNGNIETGKDELFSTSGRTDSSNRHIEYPSDAILISIDFSDESGDLSNYFYKKIIIGHGLGDLEIKEGYLFENLKFIIAQGITDKVTNIDGMFSGCPNLVDIKGLESWDISGLVDKTYFNEIYKEY